MHTHVIRTTEDKLDATVDEWLGTREPAMGAGPMPVVLHKGSRDYLVIVRHPEHDEPHDGHRPHGEPDHVMYAVTSGVGVHAPHPSVLIDRLRPSGGRERVAELAPIGAAGDPIEPLVDFTREVIAAITLRPADPLAAEKAAAIECYTARIDRERSAYWNEVVSARETLRVYGWPDARDSSVSIHHGVTWLYEQKNPPRIMTPKQVRTREVLGVIGSEGVTAEHAVYVEIDGRNHPAADVTTCNGGRGLLIVAPPLRETYSDYEVRRVPDNTLDVDGEKLVLTRRVTSADGSTGRTEALLSTELRESYTPAELLEVVRQAVGVVSPK
jgi:hypothetical protein